MPTTAEGRLKAARNLLHLTGLDGHPLVKRHVDIDRSPSDWDWQALDQERLSSGELITIGVLRAVVLGHSDVLITDLYQLDDHYRHVCVDALRLALVGAEEVVTL